MSKSIKKSCAVFLIAILSFSPFGVYASQQKEYTLDSAVKEFSDTLKLIDSVYYYSSSVDYKQLLDAALDAAFDELDTYSDYMTPEELGIFSEYKETDMVGIGVSITTNLSDYGQVRRVYKESGAEKAGILVDDIVVRIDGKDVQGLNASELRDLIVGESGTTVNITVQRNSGEHTLTITRGTFSIPFVELFDISKFIPGADSSKTAYMEITSFASSNTDKEKKDTATQFIKRYDEAKSSGAKNLIIDLRDNSGGDIDALVEMLQHFVKEGKLFEFRYNTGEATTYYSKKQGADFNIAVLVNEYTASSSEAFASAVQESGTGIIVGCNTFGKGVGQIVRDAADCSHAVKLTVAEVFSRSGARINEVGIIPDIYVMPIWKLNNEEAITESSNSEDIIALKMDLVNLGYNVNTESEKFDSQLTNAVKEFQKSVNLQADGIVSIETINALNDKLTEKFYNKDVALEAAYNALNK